MPELNIEVLKGYRDEILKAEIGALLFNLGKTHIGFWHNKDGQNYWQKHFNITDEDKFKSDFKSKFEYEIFAAYDEYLPDNIVIDVKSINVSLKDFLVTNTKINFPFDIPPNNKKAIDLFEIIKGRASNEEFVKKVFFRGCENINSGIDKGYPGKQLEETLWIANAFGSFRENIKLNDFDEARIYFYDKFHKFLLCNDYYINPNWQEIRRFIFVEIKDWYSRLLSDSRVTINDVTLWDQAYMTASMFKAVLAELFMDSSNIQNYIDNPFSIKWRILGIQYDKLGLAEKGYKPQQIQWYRDKAREIDEEIKKLLEYKYPVGNEIYRDETGIYFLVGEKLGLSGNNITELHPVLNDIKDKILDVFKEKSLDEFFPAIYLTKASRGLMNLGYLLEKAKENFLKADWSKKEINICVEKSMSGRAKSICQVCGQRLVFDSDRKDEDKNICNVCYENKTKGRIDNWLCNRDDETIWMDELKDRNDRVALVTMKFELQEWLNGNMLNSFLTNTFDDYGDLKKDLIKSILSPRDILMKLTNKIFNIFTKINDIDALDSLIDKKINGKELLQNPCINREDIAQIISLFEDLKDKNSYNELNELISDTIDEIKKQTCNADDIFIYVSKLLDYFVDKSESHKITKLRQLLTNRGKIFNNFEKKLEFLSKYVNGLDKIKCLVDILREFEKKITDLKYFIKKEERNTIPSIEKLITNYLIPFKLSSEMLHYFNEYDTLLNFYNKLFFSSIVGTKWEVWLKNLSINSKIDWDNETVKWELFTSTDDPDIEFLSTLILQFLLRKNPSPARLRRIWETTKGFIEDVKKNICDYAGIPEKRKRRFYWENIDIDDGEYYDGQAIFWAHNKKVYLISYLANDYAYEVENIEDLKNKKGDGGFNNIRRYYDDSKVEISLKWTEAKVEYYKPYMSIIDPTPISWQFIIPAEYLPNFIDNVMKKYNEDFKFVYGKLPLHIGAIIQDYKKPLYVGVKALRRIRRDLKDTKTLMIEAKAFKIKEKLNCQRTEEEINNTQNYYSLYWGKHNKGYEFYIKPDTNFKKMICDIENIGDNEDIFMIPNTFDFEFLDTNARRNDIYYDEQENNDINNKKCGKRKVYIKKQRPYSIEEYWMKFKKFRDLFREKNNKSIRTTKLHNLISIIYEKLDDFDGFEGLKAYLATSFINILDLKKDVELRDGIADILGIKTNDGNFYTELKNKMTEENLMLILDMFDFWHKSLKEV